MYHTIRWDFVELQRELLFAIKAAEIKQQTVLKKCEREPPFLQPIKKGMLEDETSSDSILSLGRVTRTHLKVRTDMQ